MGNETCFLFLIFFEEVVYFLKVLNLVRLTGLREFFYYKNSGLAEELQGKQFNGDLNTWNCFIGLGILVEC